MPGVDDVRWIVLRHKAHSATEVQDGSGVTSSHRRGVTMAPNYRSRDIVEDFLRHRLHRSGLLHRSPPWGGATGAQRRRTSLRSGPTITSHRGVAQEDTGQGKEVLS